jgi:hypothetical protein
MLLTQPPCEAGVKMSLTKSPSDNITYLIVLFFLNSEYMFSTSSYILRSNKGSNVSELCLRNQILNCPGYLYLPL